MLVYNSGYDPAFNPQLSLGWVLLSRTIQYSIEEGYRRFDFLQGDEDYKHRFGGVDSPVFRTNVRKTACVMLPTGHVEFTWAALSLLQRRGGRFGQVDYRLLALAAVASDLVDKPLALTAYKDTNAALFWGHNLWLHLIVWAAVGTVFVAAGLRRRSVRGDFYLVLPYLLAFSGHLIADRMWGFQETLFYPLGAGYWHPWVHVGEPAAMLAAYLDIIRTTPILVAFEVIGAALLTWFIVDRRLYQPDRLRAFCARAACLRTLARQEPDAQTMTRRAPGWTSN